MKVSFGTRFVDLLEDGDRICVGLSEGKSFEVKSREWWADILGRNMLDEPLAVVDVGAYSGVYAMAAAQLGYKAFAIEALPQNMQRLKTNVAFNKADGWGEIVTFEAAASDRDGEGEFLYNSGVPFTTGGSLIPDKKERTHLKVKVRMVDSLIPADAWITAMKIDVERGEAAVLRGARKTIDRCHPAILLEILDLEWLLAVEEAIPDYRRVANLDRRNFIYQWRE